MATNADSPNAPLRWIRLWPIFLGLAILGWYVWFSQFSWNALLTAAHEGDAKRVKAILARGVPVDARDPMGKSTALMAAAHNPGHVEACRVLLDNGAHIDARNAFGNTSLMLAASDGCTEVVRLLLSRGANRNATNNAGHTALYLAQKEGHNDTAALLEQTAAR